MNIIKLIPSCLLAAFLFTTLVSAQDSAQNLITTINLDLKVSDLTQDVKAVIVRCSLGTPLSADMPTEYADGYAILYEKDTSPGLDTRNAIKDFQRKNTEDYVASITFIPINGLLKSGINQKISIAMYGDKKALGWQGGECNLLLSNSKVSKIADVLNAYERGLFMPPQDCGKQKPEADSWYRCIAPGTSIFLTEVDFERFPSERANGK